MNPSTTGIQWIVSGYALVFGILLVTAGRAGDIFGRGRLFVAGLTLFGLGSLGSGLAPDIVWVNLARLVMGVGSGLLNPQVSGMIQQYFSGNIRGRAFGIFGGAIGVSVAVGPIMSGALVTLLGTSWGWRASFLVNVPIVLGAAWAAHKVFPASAWRGAEPREGTSAGRVDLDLVGMILLAITTLFVMVPFVTTTNSWLRWIPLPVAAVTLLLWMRWEASYKRRGRQPMVDLGLFAHRSFANGCLIIATLCGISPSSSASAPSS